MVYEKLFCGYIYKLPCKFSFLLLHILNVTYTPFTRGGILLTQLRPTTRVARGANYLFIQGFASSVMSLIYFVVLTRTLLNEEMGVFALLSFTLNLVPILETFALPSATAKSYDIVGDIAIIRVHEILRDQKHTLLLKLL